MLVLACSFCTVINAQEDIQEKIISKSDLPPTKAVSKSRSQDSKAIDSNQSTTISVRSGEEQVVHDTQYYQSEIDKINHHIEMIDEKIAFVNDSPEEKQKALESGWYDQMEAIKSDLRAKKTTLQSKLN